MGEQYDNRTVVTYIGIGIALIGVILVFYAIGAFIVTKAIRLALQ